MSARETAPRRLLEQQKFFDQAGRPSDVPLDAADLVAHRTLLETIGVAGRLAGGIDLARYYPTATGIVASGIARLITAYGLPPHDSIDVGRYRKDVPYVTDALERGIGTIASGLLLPRLDGEPLDLMEVRVEAGETVGHLQRAASSLAGLAGEPLDVLHFRYLQARMGEQAHLLGPAPTPPVS
jgi:hypothetical protein